MESQGLHNACVLAAVIALALWAYTVMGRLFRAIELRRNVKGEPPAPVLHLPGMAVSARELHMLSRNHFNQVLLQRKAVTPITMRRWHAAAHVDPDSIRVSKDESGKLRLKFQADAFSTCAVRLLWGVNCDVLDSALEALEPREEAAPPRWSAAGRAAGAIARWRPGGRHRDLREGAQPLVEMSPMEVAEDSPVVVQPSAANAIRDGLLTEGFLQATDGLQLSAGVGVLMEVPEHKAFDSSAQPLELSGGAALRRERWPLVIMVSGQAPLDGPPTTAATAPFEAFAQITVLILEQVDEPLLKVTVVKQVLISEGGAMDVSGIYGCEDEADGDCKICYDARKDVVLLPCRHLTVCGDCQRSLRDERCPMCRGTFNAWMTMRSVTPRRGQGL